MTIGDKIKQLRIKNKLTQSQLADKLGVSDRAVSKWESNRGDPAINMIYPIAKLFNVTTDYLFDDENHNNVAKKVSKPLSQKEKDKMIKQVVENGIIDLDKAVSLWNKDFAIELIKTYPIDKLERTYQMYKNKEWKNLLEQALKDDVEIVAKSILSLKCKEFELIKYMYLEWILKNENFSIERAIKNNSMPVSNDPEENELAIKKYWEKQIKGIESEIQDFFAADKDVRKQYIDKINNMRNLLEELENGEYSNKNINELFKTHNWKKLSIVLCSLLEHKLSCLGYEGDLYEKIKDYCNNELGDYVEYDDWNDQQIDHKSHMSELLYRLRLTRNNALHYEKNEVEPLTDVEMKECIDHIQEIEVK